MKRLIENFFSLIVLQGAYYIIPLITFPYLVSVLGVEKYGLILYSLAFTQYFVIISAYGFNLYAPREIALLSNDKNKINELFSSVLIIKLLIVTSGFFIVLFCIYYIPKFSEYKEIFLFTYGVVIGQALSPVWFFLGIEKMKIITLINVLSRTIYTISIFVFIHSARDIVLIPVFNSIGYIVAGIFGIYIARKFYSIKIFFPDKNILFFHLKKSFSFFVSRISVSIYTFSNVFVIGTFGSIELAGIYGIAEKLFNALQGIYDPLVNVLYPFITKEKNVKLFKKIFLFAILVNTIGLIIVYYNATGLFVLLFKNFNVLGVTIFKILLIACFFIVPSSLLGYPFLAALGYPKFTNFSVSISSLFHLIVLTMLVLTGNVKLIYFSIAVILTVLMVLGIRIYGIVKFNLWRNQ